MKKQFKKGEFVFCEFSLRQVMNVNEFNQVTDVSDGFSRLGGSELDYKTFPLTIGVKLISEKIKGIYDSLHRFSREHAGGINFNFPDIHRYFVDKWVEACDVLPYSICSVIQADGSSEDYSKINNIITELENFAAAFRTEKNWYPGCEFNGVRLLRYKSKQQ